MFVTKSDGSMPAGIRVRNQQLRDLARFIRHNKRWVQFIHNSLESLHMAREGGLLSTVLATMHIAGDAAGNLLAEEGPNSYLSRSGYVKLDSPIDGFIANLLETSPPVRTERLGDWRVDFWGVDAGIACVYNASSGEWNTGPYVRGGEDDELYDMLTACVWAMDRDILIGVSLEGGYNWRARDKFKIAAVPSPGPYVGTLNPAYYAARLRRYGDEPRTLLIEGPTRVGKSVLARHIAAELAGSNRTLKVDGSDIWLWDSAELPNIMRFVKPSVLLVDDIDMTHAIRMLAILEAIRVSGSTVILTSMVQTDRTKERKPGDRYVEGMGPGRIDEILTLFPPDAENRDLIMRYYYGMFNMPVPAVHAELVARTDGLTGGYLAEIVRRIKVHGEETWERELTDVLYFSPCQSEEPDSDSPDKEKPVEAKQGRVTKLARLSRGRSRAEHAG